MILAANEVPSINDITASELEPLVERVAAFDPVVREAIDGNRLRVVSSGSDLPVIDLSRGRRRWRRRRRAPTWWCWRGWDER